MRITVLSGKDFLGNPRLHKELIALAQPSYEDASIVLASAITTYDTVYLAYDTDGNLVSFYMSGHEDITVGQRIVPSIHLGWTCSTQEAKGSGIARLVYEKFIYDELSMKQAKDPDLLLWGTTASPIGFHLYYKHFIDVSPNQDGSYPESAIEVAEALRKRLGVADPSDHPFVLKRCNKARFSQEELKRIEAVTNAKGFCLFQTLGIDERQGDRLLVTCRFPRS